ncbi:MAG: hypothetical protein RSF79_31065, partial [Janthinobacterium sp.]
GDIRYPLTIQCERNEGRSFGASLLPMGRSRLVIACEVPEGIDLKSTILNIVVQGASQKVAIQFGS